MKKVMILVSFSLSGCIGDDILSDRIEAQLRLLNPIDTLALGDSYQFELAYFNMTGVEENLQEMTWSSSATEIISIDQQGIALARREGRSILTVAGTTIDGSMVATEWELVVGKSTILSGSARKGKLTSTSSYLLTGDFQLSESTVGVALAFSDNYSASSALPGLYLYLSNNPNSIDSAFEIGKVEIFEGMHHYEIKEVKINDYAYLIYYCKPFQVKVGEGTFDN
ncbi:MAG: hypothetical protein KDC80_03350 [Saprospiraceae bacterium]|nr:hypothetical protein [Saprospiraceae bacterium]